MLPVANLPLGPGAGKPMPIDRPEVSSAFDQLWILSRAGGPGQRLIGALYSRINGLGEIRRLGPKGQCRPEWLRPRRSAGIVPGSGAAEIRPKPLRKWARKSRERWSGYRSRRGGGSASWRFAHRQAQTRQEKLAVLGVP